MPTGIIFDIKKYALHDGPGTRTTVFLKGCPLKCKWCHNPEGISPSPQILYYKNRCLACEDCVNACPQKAITLVDGYIQLDFAKCTQCEKCAHVCSTGALEIAGKFMGAKEVIALVEKDILFFDQSQGGVTFSGGEPLAQADFITELLLEAKKINLHTVVDTSGLASIETFLKIIPNVDLFLYDIKSLDNTRHQTFTGVSNSRILSNFVQIAPLANAIIVRIPIIPGFNDQAEDILNIAAFVREKTEIKRIDLLPYHTIAREKYLRLGKRYSMKALDPIDGSKIQILKDILVSRDFEVVVGG